MEDDQNDADARSMLTELELKHLSRHIKEIVPQVEVDSISVNDSSKLIGSLDRIFRTAESRDITAAHRVAAWNTLCATIDQCLKAEALSKLLWSHGIFDRAFDLLINQSHKARPKSSKQLLATLSSTLSNKTNPLDERLRLSKRLANGIFSEQASYRSKSCLQALAHFLRKDVLNLDDVLASLGHARYDEGNTNDSRTQELLRRIFLKACEGDLGSAVSQVIEVVLDRVALIDRSDTDGETSRGTEPRCQAIWMQPLESVIRSEQVPIDELRFHILPTLFRRDLSEYVGFLERHGLPVAGTEGSTMRIGGDQSDTAILDLLCAGLQIGKELGLLLETNDVAATRTTTSILVPVRWIGCLLSSSSRRARLTGLSLLITSPSATRPLSRSSLRLIRQHLHIFFSDTDANFRSEIFTMMQRLMDRFRAITAVLARKSDAYRDNGDNEPVLARKSLRNHFSFLEWLLRFLSWELRPTASYQRHISALKTLAVLARSGIDKTVPLESLSKSAHSESKWPFELSIMGSGLRHLLLDLVLNPFEDVRQTSFSILFMFSTPGCDDFNLYEELLVIIRRAEQRMLLTGRADQADGVAYLYALLYKGYEIQKHPPETSLSSRAEIVVHLIESLESMLDVAESSLSAAVEKYPAHGLFTSLRYLLIHNDIYLSCTDSLARITACLHQIWNIVRPVLCDDAPEGYLPDDDKDTTAMATKDILSYCWRGLKESSLLLEAMVSRCDLAPPDLLSLSSLSFTQLAKLRHRGAFSTVAHTWSTCCIHCLSVPSNGHGYEVRVTYKRVLDTLTRTDTINTRRSAGLPALLCGVLVSDASGKLVEDAFDDLGSIARQSVKHSKAPESSLPQVHALNCIKDILKHSRLRQHSERYVPNALRLAAESLRSPSWAIRNCGLMLFRAAIDRLFGTSNSYLEDDSHIPRRTQIQHTDILDTVLDLLVLPVESNDAVSANTSEGVFPALQLLQRAQIPKDRLVVAASRVFVLTGNRSWHVRDKAARTYATLITTHHIEVNVEYLLSSGGTRQNALHGALLCIKYLIRQLTASQLSLVGTDSTNCETAETSTRSAMVIKTANVVVSSSHLYRKNNCSITKAAYIDTLIEVSRYGRNIAGGNELRRITETIQASKLNILHELERTLNHDLRHGGNAALRASLARGMGCGLHAMKEGSLAEHEMCSLLCRLAERDSDACVAFFRAAMGQQQDLRNGSMPEAAVFQAARAIVEGDFGISLRCEVLRCLLKFQERSQTRKKDSHHPTVFVEACVAAASPTIVQADQQYADLWLETTAVGIEYHRMSSISTEKRLELTVEVWMAAWREAVHGQSFCSTEAAATSVTHLSDAMRYLRQANSVMFREVCFGTYDLLNDDDESVRLLAAQAASNLVERDPKTNFHQQLEPIAASQQLVQLMIDEWNDNPAFIREVIGRALGMGEEKLDDVAHQLADADTAATSLFAEEKQNLYIDDARESRVWSHAMLKVKAAAVPNTLLQRVAYWVAAGLDALADKLQASVDGAIGWTTKHEVFVLGSKVINGAEILLHVVQQGCKILVRPSTLRAKLGRLCKLAQSDHTNILWQRELERVMSWAVVSKLRQTQKVMSEVDKSLFDFARGTQ